MKKTSSFADQLSLFGFLAGEETEVIGADLAALVAIAEQGVAVPARPPEPPVLLQVEPEAPTPEELERVEAAAQEAVIERQRRAEQAAAERVRQEQSYQAAYLARMQGMVMSIPDVDEETGLLDEQPETEAVAPELLASEVSSGAPQWGEIAPVIGEIASIESLDGNSYRASSTVTFHKHGKLLLVKPNDSYAADVWREITARLKNTRMANIHYFDGLQESEAVPSKKELHELWRWVECGLDGHPYMKVLASYGLCVEVSASLAGYMRNQKRKLALRQAPYPCYESSPDDITECIISGMILKCKEEMPGQSFKLGKRYLVKALNETDGVEVYLDPIHARALLSDNSDLATVTKQDIQRFFEDSDKFVVTDNIRDLFPEPVAKMESLLSTLPIGQDGRLFEHSRQDVVCEVLKGDFLCSKDMRMGKSREAIAACELLGSKKISWIGPSNANIDIPNEFRAGGAENFKEIERISDLDSPAKYHIMTLDFLKKESDPLRRVRRGQKSKTWLRSMGEGRSICDCPHCGQPMERPVHDKSNAGRILRTTWTLYNGYLCRNPYCVWTEVSKPRKSTRSSGKQKIAPTPWHNAGQPAAVTHQGGYIDWQRKQHSECGDHVGRTRMCPKCGMADASWQPAIYKRIKKNYGTVVIDEIQLTMDDGSQASTAALDMRGRHHLGLSGTPMSKHLVDMFPQLMWIFRTRSKFFPFDRATGKSEYKERFCENIRIQREGTDRVHYKTLPFARDPVDFWNFSAPLLVRRTRNDKVYKESLAKLGLKLPGERTFVMPVRMVGPQALLLSASITEFQSDFADYCRMLDEEGHSLNSHIVMTMMSRMKIAATVPGFLNRPGKPVVYHGGDLDPSGIGGKGVALSSLVPAKIMEGKKIVIMSQYVMMREKLAAKFAHLHPVLLPSGTVAQKRKALDEFRHNSERPLTIVGAKQVCLGVELNCADVLMNVDLMWEAAAQKQALARLMGATTYDRMVENYILVSEHSLDEHIYNDFYGKIAGMEQALDKRVITRSAESVNWVAFADSLIAQQAALESYFRGSDDEKEGIAMPSLDDDLLMRCA